MRQRTGTVIGQARAVAPTAGDQLVTIGAGLFGIGLLAILVVLVPYFVGADRMPVGVYLAAMLSPIGLAVALLGMLAGVRARRRRP